MRATRRYSACLIAVKVRCRSGPSACLQEIPRLWRPRSPCASPAASCRLRSRRCLVAVAGRLRTGIELFVQSLGDAGQHGRGHQIGIGIDARRAMLDAAVLRVARRHAQRHRAVVDAPGRRDRRIGLRHETPPGIGVRREHQHGFGHGCGQAAERLQQSQRPALAVPASAKTLPPASSSSETWRCMPEPAYFSIGLAMKQAVTPCRRACARTSALQQDQVVGRLQHILAVVAASVRIGPARIPRSPSRPECPARLPAA